MPYLRKKMEKVLVGPQSKLVLIDRCKKAMVYGLTGGTGVDFTIGPIGPGGKNSGIFGKNVYNP